VDHTDPTANTVQVLEKLLKTGWIQWYQQLEGVITELIEYRLNGEEGQLLTAKNNEISFTQCVDYTNVKSRSVAYDAIVVDIRFSGATEQLMHMTERLSVGGILVLASIDQIEEKSFLSGFERVPLEGVEKVIPSEAVAAEGGLSVPHLFKETANKHQYAISHVSCWRKVGAVSVKKTGELKGATNHSVATTTYYEDQSILDSYEKFHFGALHNGVPNFPEAVGKFCLEMAEKFGNGKYRAAMDAGSGPGRTAFELCRKFAKVEAFDYSSNFVDSLKRHQNQFLGEAVASAKMTSYQGDAHTMKVHARLPVYDLIIGCNLIDRLHSPELWVQQAKELVSDSKGIVVVCSPYTWKQIHTAEEKWIGGKFVNAEKYFTQDGLCDLMAPEFELKQVRKIIFSIPDSDGTYQYTASNCTVFARK
jgi:SAM-dependent methyltransferase